MRYMILKERVSNLETQIKKEMGRTVEKFRFDEAYDVVYIYDNSAYLFYSKMNNLTEEKWLENEGYTLGNPLLELEN